MISKVFWRTLSVFIILDLQIISGAADKSVPINIENMKSTNLKPHDFCQPFCEPDCPSGSVCIAQNQCQPQHDNSNKYYEFPKQRTWITNSSKDCGQGQLSQQNKTVLCSYDLNGTICTEPPICAVIFRDDEPKIAEKLISLRSIIFGINETKESGPNMTRNMNNHDVNWCRRRCTDEYRITIASENFSESVHDEVINCHELELYNLTTGFVLLNEASTTNQTQNQLRLCLLKAVSIFNTTVPTTKDDTFGSISVRDLVAWSVSFILAIGVGTTVYLNRQRFRKIRGFHALSASKETMMDQSVASARETYVY